MYDDVLLPVDESATAGARAVVRHAGELARWADATLHLLYVADTTRDSVTVVGTDVVDALVREGESVLADVAEGLDDLGVDYEGEVVQGDPASTIVDYARDCDLVVMPTHGREGLSRHFLGSVTERVVRRAPEPVIAARAREDERLRFPYERLLVATDGSEAAAHAARHGLDLAAALDAEVTALSVVDDTAGRAVRDLLGEDRERTASEACAAVAADGAERGVEVTERVVHGAPAEEVVAAVDSTDADLVVVGATGRRGVDDVLLGSVADRTVRSAPVPVLTVGGDRGDESRSEEAR
jgi:nucleotide-binding universal stress UspA family protein